MIAWSIFGPIGDAAGWVWDGVVGKVVGVAGDVINSLATGVANALAYVVTKIAEAVGGVEPSLTASGFVHSYTSPAVLGAALAVLFLIVTIARASISGRPDQIAVGALRYQVALGLIIITPGIGNLLLGLTDAMSNALAATLEGDLSATFAALIKVMLTPGTGAQGLPVILLLVGGVIGLIAALVIAFTFLIRSAVIYLLIFFMPLAIAAWVYKGTSGALGKLCLKLLGYAMMKPIVTGTFVLAVALLGSPGSDGFVALLSGIGMLLVVCLVPFAVLGVMSNLAGDGSAAREGKGGAAGAGAAAGLAARRIPGLKK